MYEVTKVVTRNLNKVIDRNYYPVPGALKSNMRHRPIGLGVQGLADAFILVRCRRRCPHVHPADPLLIPPWTHSQMRYPYESNEARQLNTDIFETIYFAAMTASMEMTMKDGPYETYPGSPVSQGEGCFGAGHQTGS